MDNLLAGVYTLDAEDDDHADDYQHPSFEEYVKTNEKTMKERLKSLDYHIDDRNTMTLITGTGRLEQVFPTNSKRDYYFIIRTACYASSVSHFTSCSSHRETRHT